MKHAVRIAIGLLLAMACAVPAALAQAQLAGDWQGTLAAGGAQLRLVLHITAGKDGALTATLDSVDQGALGIPVTAITVKGSAFNLTIDAVHGTYAGTINKYASEIDGTWSQGQPLELNFKRMAAQPAAQPAKPAPPSEIDGTWTGTLDTGQTQLRVVFKITNTGDGLTAKMQSPDQSPVWLTASSVKRDGAQLTIELTRIGVTFAGKIAPDFKSIDGAFSQMGNDFPLMLARNDEAPQAH